jgi:hypothetical protein
MSKEGGRSVKTLLWLPDAPRYLLQRLLGVMTGVEVEWGGMGSAPDGVVGLQISQAL